MILSLAVNNLQSHGTHPALVRQAKAKSRFLCRASQLYAIGSKVNYRGEAAKVIGYNIADFGRWLGISHPILVELDDGTTQMCRLADLSDSARELHFF